jgi:hypothetical protein
MMLEWPGRCHTCNKQIEDWADAGLDDSRWVHKTCYTATSSEAAKRGVDLPALRSPIERSKSLEWPMLISLLFFHFGIGFGFMGWIMLTQDVTDGPASTAYILLGVGLITPILGVAGIALNIIGRRRIELVRQALDLSGGWKPSI